MLSFPFRQNLRIQFWRHLYYCRGKPVTGSGYPSIRVGELANVTTRHSCMQLMQGLSTVCITMKDIYFACLGAC